MEAEKSHEQQLASWNWGPRRAEGISSSVRLKAEAPCPSSKTIRQREQILPSPTVSFYSALNGLDEVHPHGGRPSALLSLVITVFVSSRNTFTDIPRIMCSCISSYSVGQLCWHTKLTIPGSIPFPSHILPPSIRGSGDQSASASVQMWKLVLGGHLFHSKCSFSPNNYFLPSPYICGANESL